MIQFDPETQSYYELPDEGLNPMTGRPAAPAQAPYAGEGPGFHGFDYWQGQGVDPASMFGADGQMLPGWQRTANGYERAEASAPDGGMGPLAPPSTGAGWMPQFTAPKFQAPAPFSFEAFTAPTMDQAREEPGFAFAMEQGRKALENSAAGKGTLRTGGTLKDIFAFGNRMGEQNYGNVFGRAKDTYGINRGNAADTYATNYGVSRDVFDRDYRGALDEYQPKAREAELNQAQSFQEWLAKTGLSRDLFLAGQD